MDFKHVRDLLGGERIGKAKQRRPDDCMSRRSSRAGDASAVDLVEQRSRDLAGHQPADGVSGRLGHRSVRGQVVALAVLMPIVASMGGIAATQTSTLISRGIALGQVGGNVDRLMESEPRAPQAKRRSREQDAGIRCIRLDRPFSML
jgi:hypothetical protein